MFKKFLISWIAVLTSLSSSAFAQSVDFDTTYSTLIDQVITEATVSTQNPRDAISSKGSTTFSIRSSDSEMNISAQVSYNHITQERKAWTYSEGNVAIDSTIGIGFFDELGIDTMKLQGNIDFKLTPTTAFIKINSLSLNTSALPEEIRSDVDTMIAALLNKAQGKWIRILLPKELRDEIKAGQEFSPQAIINLLKEYPLVKNAGYKNNAFSVELNTDHIMALLIKYDLIGSQEEYESMFDRQTYDEYLEEEKNYYPDTFKSESEFNALTYEDYIELFKEMNSYDLILTSKEYRTLMNAFDKNSSEFLSLVKLTFPSEQIALPEDLTDELILEYLKEEYPEELTTHSIEEVWYYDSILSSDTLPRKSEFEQLDYATFLSENFSISSKEDFLSNQKDWNEYVEENYNPEMVKKEMRAFISQLPIQGTLSATDTPTLQLTTKATQDFPLNSSLSINNNNLRVSGEMKEYTDYGDGDRSASTTKFSASLQSKNNVVNYALDLSVIDTSSWYEPSSFLVNISGNESYSIKENYKFIRPKGAINGNRLFSSLDLF